MLDACSSFGAKILSNHGLWEENTNIMTAIAASLDEMPQFSSFNLGLNCLLLYQFCFVYNV